MLLERTSRKVLFTRPDCCWWIRRVPCYAKSKMLKEMASQQGETMSGPLHIGLIPTIGLTCCHKSYRCYTRRFQSWKCTCMKPKRISCWLNWTAASLTAILALVKSEAFIEVPLFDEPMMLAIYEDHPWANRDRVPMSGLAGEKLLMLEDGHCLRDQAMGFCFEGRCG